ncbi:Glutathione peroxidase 6 [Bulinus truncatus]|nr:Glutathione peroxidase 6 [Bulinus truncatus]
MGWPNTGVGGLLATFCGLLAVVNAGVMLHCNQSADDTRSIYDYSLMNVHKNVTINLSDYRGKFHSSSLLFSTLDLSLHYFSNSQAAHGKRASKIVVVVAVIVAAAVAVVVAVVIAVVVAVVVVAVIVAVVVAVVIAVVVAVVAVIVTVIVIVSVIVEVVVVVIVAVAVVVVIVVVAVVVVAVIVVVVIVVDAVVVAVVIVAVVEEPGANGTEILNGIKYVRPGNGFVPNFQLFEKIEVNGENEHKLYTYLKSNCPPTTTTFIPTRLFYTPIRSNDVAWNWEVFMVGHDGKVVKRAIPQLDPLKLAEDIELELARARQHVHERSIYG